MTHSLKSLAVIYLAWLAFAAYIFANAWVSEDAYITFRVLDNFFHGYGLRWNIHERVQVYTHPLWMLLHIPLYAIGHNLYRADIALSILCSTAALLIVPAGIPRPAPIVLIAFFLPLALSKSFLDYTTSGLENPLSYLIYALFGHVLLNLRRHPQFWFFCSLTLALALFNRLDSIILYAPALGWLIYRRWGRISFLQIALGLLPLLGWLAFSLFYYGFLFPNTKYAKLDTQMPILNYINQGIHYAKYMLTVDMVGTVAIASSLGFIIAGIRSKRATLPLCLAFGIYLYVFYIILVGGDYMAGRFWALPIFASVWLFYACAPLSPRPDVLFALTCLILVLYAIPILTGEIHKHCGPCVVGKGRLIDARNTFSSNQLVTGWRPLHMRREGRYQFADTGKKLAAQDPPPVTKEYFIGMAGYYAGPKVIIIDELGLADPLLARLPAAKNQGFFIGHFRRTLPEGYMHAVETHSTAKMDPALAHYYDKLTLITSGDLLDKDRLLAIIAFNLGLYDYWKQDYLARNP